MTADDLKQLHPSDVVLWLHVEKAAWRLVCASRANVSEISPTPKNNIRKNLQDGTLWGSCCYSGKKVNKSRQLLFTVRTFIPEFGWSRDRVPLHSLIDTVAHEVAHAKCDWSVDHGPKFFRQFGKMILLAEKINIRRDILAAGVKLPA